MIFYNWVCIDQVAQLALFKGLDYENEIKRQFYAISACFKAGLNVFGHC